MIPWSVIWAFIPKKYLIGAAAIAALLLGSYAAVRLYGSHRESKGYHAGAAHVTDSVNAIAIKRIAKAETVYVHVADSAVAKARHTDSLIAATPRQRIVIQTVPLSVVRDSIKPELVRVIVAATNDTVDNVPLRAAQYWSAADSVAGLAIQSASQWRTAYGAEHQARIGADSLSALWRTRALNIPAAAKPNMHRIAYLTLGIVAGFVAARHIR